MYRPGERLGLRPGWDVGETVFPKNEVASESQLESLAVVHMVLATCSIPVRACIVVMLPALLSCCFSNADALTKSSKDLRFQGALAHTVVWVWQGMSCGYMFDGVALLPRLNEHCWPHSQSIARQQAFDEDAGLSEIRLSLCRAPTSFRRQSLQASRSSTP